MRTAAADRVLEGHKYTSLMPVCASSRGELVMQRIERSDTHHLLSPKAPTLLGQLPAVRSGVTCLLGMPLRCEERSFLG